MENQQPGTTSHHAIAPGLTPTWTGFVPDTYAALQLFEAVNTGALQAFTTRTTRHEQENLIRSGSIFIYNEASTGIKRWNDGVDWSPSRINGNFLLYRELDDNIDRTKKRTALRKMNPKKTDGIGKASYSAPSSSTSTANIITPWQRSLYGSLIDSYQFKQNGLMKKTISIIMRDVRYHMVSYYSVQDVEDGKLCTPSQHYLLCNIYPSPVFIRCNTFRAPIVRETELEDPNGNNLVPGTNKADPLSIGFPIEPLSGQRPGLYHQMPYHSLFTSVHGNQDPWLAVQEVPPSDQALTMQLYDAQIHLQPTDGDRIAGPSNQFLRHELGSNTPIQQGDNPSSPSFVQYSVVENNGSWNQLWH